MQGLKIAYAEYTSIIDYPGKLSAVVWTIGCNLRCPFCYNAELVLSEFREKLAKEKDSLFSEVNQEEVLAALGERRGFLDGLVITGGEPTLQPGLGEFLAPVKKIGLAVKLDTNGTRPDVLSELLARGLVDYIALDVKAPFPRYGEFTGLGEGAPEAVAAVQASISLIREKAPDYEFRTTVAPGLSPEDLALIAASIQGGKRYFLQSFFIPEGKRLVDESWRERPHLLPGELTRVAEELSRFLPCAARV